MFHNQRKLTRRINSGLHNQSPPPRTEEQELRWQRIWYIIEVLGDRAARNLDIIKFDLTNTKEKE